MTDPKNDRETDLPDVSEKRSDGLTGRPDAHEWRHLDEESALKKVPDELGRLEPEINPMSTDDR